MDTLMHLPMQNDFLLPDSPLCVKGGMGCLPHVKKSVEVGKRREACCMPFPLNGRSMLCMMQGRATTLINDWSTHSTYMLQHCSWSLFAGGPCCGYACGVGHSRARSPGWVQDLCLPGSEATQQCTMQQLWSAP